MTTVLNQLKPKFVCYHKTRQEDHVELIVVANISDETVEFSLSILRRGKQKEDVVYNRYRLQPHCTLHYYPRLEACNEPISLKKGDRLRARSSRKGSLVITIIGTQS